MARPHAGADQLQRDGQHVGLRDHDAIRREHDPTSGREHHAAHVHDRDALDDLRHVSARHPRPIVMFTDRDDPEFVRDAIGDGVSSYNVVGARLPEIKPINRPKFSPDSVSATA